MDECKPRFDGKYTPFMLEEPELEVPDGSSGGDSGDAKNGRGPRVSFLIVPSDKVAWLLRAISE